jgi:uncharacterized hydrophobic protein (TIGR00271 family)
MSHEDHADVNNNNSSGLSSSIETIGAGALVDKSMISSGGHHHEGTSSSPSSGSNNNVSSSNSSNNKAILLNSGSIGLQHVKEFMRNSTHFSEITQEQIDRVRLMHDRFQEGSQFSFNYNTLLAVVSILAGLGLVSNSLTAVIAIMLVSPIMGPVVGIAYGATIWDWRLCRTALKTDVASLVFCILVGVIIGACCGSTDLADSWPTEEMKSRASYESLYVALPVAFFSGLGVAVSLLDEQTSSLVGVAISASLLPPAINAGVIWVAYGFYENGQEEGDDGEYQNGTSTDQ